MSREITRDPDGKTPAGTGTGDLTVMSSTDSHARAIAPPPDIPDYQLLKRIGSGSYGEVWLAQNITGSYRAVKLVYRAAFESQRPFEREFDGIRRFEPISQSHESQLKILHVGQRESYFYYVMELADDATAVKQNQKFEIQNWPCYLPRTLRREIQERGRLPAQECVEVAIRLTQALSHLHKHGLVHRDIKPSNIIFVYGLPKLADIGLVADTEHTLTFVGTEGYLPPEGPGKPAADIFSLGKVLYEISTGQDRNQFPELPPYWDSATEREAFAELNEIIIKACAADVAQRYETAEQMYEDLLLLRAGKSVKRLRALERRLASLRKISFVGVTLTAVLTAGYFYQHHQTRTSERLAAQLQVNIGVQRLNDSDLYRSLPWFTEALARAEPYLSSDEKAQHRLRIGAVLQQCSSLAHVIFPDLGDGKVAGYFHSGQFSPDGAQILISGYGRTVLICDAATGATVHRLEHLHNVGASNFSRDGRRVITGLHDTQASIAGEIQVWDAKTGQQIGRPLSHQTRDQWLAGVLSDDGRRVLTYSRREAQVWDVDTGQKISPLLVHDKFVKMARFSADGQRVLIATGVAQLWDVATGNKLGLPIQYDGQVLAIGTEWSSTPLACAAREGKKEMVAWLLNKGANPNLPDDEPWAVPAEWAIRRGHREILELLKKRSAK